MSPPLLPALQRSESQGPDVVLVDIYRVVPNSTVYGELSYELGTCKCQE